jgi:hypothetical protein
VSISVPFITPSVQLGMGGEPTSLGPASAGGMPGSPDAAHPQAHKRAATQREPSITQGE